MSAKPDVFDAARSIVDTLQQFDATDQQVALRWAQERLGLPATTGSGVLMAPLTNPAVSTPQPATPLATPPGTAKDIKSFMDEKKPKSDNQFAAAVAYYHKFEAPDNQRKDAINKDDLVDACRKAQHKRPGAPAQVLVNALHQGLLDKAERGQYQINSVGENLVAMVLPGDGLNGRSTVRKKTKQKGTKKTKRLAKKKKA